MLITALPNVARQVGTNRILVGPRFHHPVGDPSRPPEQERAWRREFVDRALVALETEVIEPTVFE